MKQHRDEVKPQGLPFSEVLPFTDGSPRVTEGLNRGGSAGAAAFAKQSMERVGMEAFYIVVLVSTALVLLAAFSSLLAFRFGAPCCCSS